MCRYSRSLPPRSVASTTSVKSLKLRWQELSPVASGERRSSWSFDTQPTSNSSSRSKNDLETKPASELADWRRDTKKNTTVFFQQKLCQVTTEDQNCSKQLHIHNTSYSPIFYPPFYPKDLHSCHYCKHTKISFWVFPTSGCLWNSGKCENPREAEPCGKNRAADSSTVSL